MLEIGYLVPRVLIGPPPNHAELGNALAVSSAECMVIDYSVDLPFLLASDYNRRQEPETARDKV